MLKEVIIILYLII
jgi:hypothetical protein